jgi:hypothetical protein
MDLLQCEAASKRMHFSASNALQLPTSAITYAPEADILKGAKIWRTQMIRPRWRVPAGSYLFSVSF